MATTQPAPRRELTGNQTLAGIVAIIVVALVFDLSISAAFWILAGIFVAAGVVWLVGCWVAAGVRRVAGWVRG